MAWTKRAEPDREEERRLYRRMTPYRVAQRLEQERDIYQAALEHLRGGLGGPCGPTYPPLEWVEAVLGDVRALRKVWAAEDAEALK